MSASLHFCWARATSERADSRRTLYAGRTNWTKAVDAVMCTWKQQVEKGFSGVKDLLNEMAATSGPSPQFEGASSILRARRGIQLLIRRSHGYGQARKRSALHPDVPWSERSQVQGMHWHVFACSCMYQHVSSCISIYSNVFTCTRMYRHVSACICMYHHVSACIQMYLYVLACIGMYRNVLPCMRMYQHVFGCSILHYLVLVCILMYSIVL